MVVDDHGYILQRAILWGFIGYSWMHGIVAKGGMEVYTLVSTVMCYVSACNWASGRNMMFLTLWLSRTLEMMQNDVRSSGIDGLFRQKWFWCKMVLFHEVCEQHWWFGIHLRWHCKWIEDVSEWCQAEVGRFGLFHRCLHVLVVNKNQHVLNQTACFISGSCRMFLW